MDEDIKYLIDKRTEQINNIKEKIKKKANHLTKEELIDSLNDLINEKIK